MLVRPGFEPTTHDLPHCSPALYHAEKLPSFFLCSRSCALKIDEKFTSCSLLSVVVIKFSHKRYPANGVHRWKFNYISFQNCSVFISVYINSIPELDAIVWVEFVVDSLLCSVSFFIGRVLRFSALLKNQHIQIPTRSGWSARTPLSEFSRVLW